MVEAVIRQALSRFNDGTDTSRYDVFDYAELCCKLGNQEAQRVLGWSESKVIKHSNIKTTLHPLAWGIARLTRNFNLSGVGDLAIVSQKLTIVTWSESHFRALLSYLPLNGHRDNAVMRGQLGVIRQALSRFSDDSNVTKAG